MSTLKTTFIQHPSASEPAIQLHSSGTVSIPSFDAVPSGVIVFWSGSEISIPSGWFLCDGENSTPDLRDRFIVGAGGAYSVDETGGLDSVSLTADQIPSHSHSAGSLVTSTTGAHTHTYVTRATANGRQGSSGNVYNVGTSTPNTGSSGDHSHSITGETGLFGSGDSHENRPPYYALAYIMKG